MPKAFRTGDLLEALSQYVRDLKDNGESEEIEDAVEALTGCKATCSNADIITIVPDGANGFDGFP